MAHSLRPLAKTADPADSTRTPSPVRIPPASLSAAAFEKLSTRVKDGTAALKDGGSVSLSAGMQRLGGKLLTCKGVCVDVPGRRVVDDLDYEFNRKDRIGIVGPNGAGKSTLIRALQGEIELAAGSIETGATVTFGHYDQRGLGDELPEDLRVLAFVQEAVATAPGGGASADADEKAATSLLSRFLFPPRRWHERVAMLSGGERRRLQMLRVLAKQPNFLLLDEPTNDLDLDTISVLEDFLRDEYSSALARPPPRAHTRPSAERAPPAPLVPPPASLGCQVHGRAAGRKPRPLFPRQGGRAPLRLARRRRRRGARLASELHRVCGLP